MNKIPTISFPITVSAPQHLSLEKQLNKSVLIGWAGPDPPGNQMIESYHVYVDGVLKVTVKANERTRALVEGVDLNRVGTKRNHHERNYLSYFQFENICLITYLCYNVYILVCQTVNIVLLTRKFSSSDTSNTSGLIFCSSFLML